MKMEGGEKGDEKRGKRRRKRGKRRNEYEEVMEMKVQGEEKKILYFKE